jgi:dolichol kinase
MKHIWRRIYNIAAGSIFPVMYIFMEKNIVLLALLITTALVVSFELLRFKAPAINKLITKKFSYILKKRETNEITGTTYYLISSLLAILFFDKDIAILAILFLVFGDAAASIIGTSLKSMKIWNKSLLGSISMFTACLIIGFIFNKLTTLQIITGSFSATIAELLPIDTIKPRLDDNLTIPLISGLIMSVV